jgi:hypothetical protein
LPLRQTITLQDQEEEEEMSEKKFSSAVAFMYIKSIIAMKI